MIRENKQFNMIKNLVESHSVVAALIITEALLTWSMHVTRDKSLAHIIFTTTSSIFLDHFSDYGKCGNIRKERDVKMSFDRRGK